MKAISITAMIFAVGWLTGSHAGYTAGAESEHVRIDALDAHTTMSAQALESKRVQREIIKILLDHSSLYEDLRARASSSPH